MSHMHGLGFLSAAFGAMQRGVCPSCREVLPPLHHRSYTFTCDQACHTEWVRQLLVQYGETRVITSLETKKSYLVPTRVILEEGITHEALVAYPEVATV